MRAQCFVSGEARAWAVPGPLLLPTTCGQASMATAKLLGPLLLLHSRAEAHPNCASSRVPCVLAALLRSLADAGGRAAADMLSGDHCLLNIAQHVGETIMWETVESAPWPITVTGGQGRLNDSDLYARGEDVQV